MKNIYHLKCKSSGCLVNTNSYDCVPLCCPGTDASPYMTFAGKLRKKSISEDFDNDPEPIFKATFGNKWYTWTFKSWQESSFQNSTSGFEWRERSGWKNSRAKRWETQSEAESDEDSCAVGSRSDRTILGLPPTGPLKIEDVKNA
jgi:hypothetical protein